MVEPTMAPGESGNWGPMSEFPRHFASGIALVYIQEHNKQVGKLYLVEVWCISMYINISGPPFAWEERAGKYLKCDRHFQ